MIFQRVVVIQHKLQDVVFLCSFSCHQSIFQSCSTFDGWSPAKILVFDYLHVGCPDLHFCLCLRSVQHLHSSCLNAEFMIMHYLTQMLHVWNIYLHLGDFWGFYVGKYSIHGAYGMVKCSTVQPAYGAMACRFWPPRSPWPPGKRRTVTALFRRRKKSRLPR